MDEHTLRLEYEALEKRYKLVSDLLTAKPNEHVELKKFENLLNGEFREFADAESSLAEEAAAVQRLERLANRLKELVVFPHLFAKRSIAIGGGFSSGKSAFVNSFIDGYDHLLPERIEPATAIPSFVVANSEMAIKGFSRTGDTVDIDPALYSQLSHSFIDTFSFNLKDIMPSITVEVPLRDSLFDNICLIDTPGYNPGGRSADRTTAADFLKDRDALIWMIGLDSTGTVPDEDLDFLEGLELGSLPFYVVLNKADIKPRSELEDVLDEVRDTFTDAGFEPLGISVYSSRRGKEFSYDAMSLADFFRQQNQPREANTDLKEEIESVFAMYANAIRKDERTARWMTNELKAIDFHISDLSADDADILGEKISKLIDSQKRDFAPIKNRLGDIRQKMLSAVDEIFWSLNFAKPELTAREAAEKSEENEFIAEVGRKPSPDNKGVTDLHHAARLNLAALAQCLLGQGADLNAKAILYARFLDKSKVEAEDDEGEIEDCTPLHAAAFANARDTAEVLLQNGADINAKTENGATPLHAAVFVKAWDTAEVLLQNGADVNAKTEDGSTPLHVAARMNARDTAEVLLKRSADVNAKTEDGSTPLHVAVRMNAWDTAEVLLQNGADVNAKTKSGTLLHVAVRMNARKMAEVLLQNGADVNAKTEDGSTPLHMAAFVKARKMAEVLLQNGADVNAKTEDGSTPLHMAAQMNARDTAEVLLKWRLLRRSADVNAKTEDGSTPLHVAAQMNARDTAEVLLKWRLLKRGAERSADVNAKTEDGSTPLHMAAQMNARDTAEVLLKWRLLKRGAERSADVNAKTEDGSTPLHVAAQMNARDTAEVLLKRGADVNAEDRTGFFGFWGKKPLAIAEEKGASKTAELLRRHGGQR